MRSVLAAHGVHAWDGDRDQRFTGGLENLLRGLRADTRRIARSLTRPRVGQLPSVWADLLGLRPLGTADSGVLDPLVVLQAGVTVSLDGGVVDEDVRRAV